MPIVDMGIEVHHAWRAAMGVATGRDRVTIHALTAEAAMRQG